MTEQNSATFERNTRRRLERLQVKHSLQPLTASDTINLISRLARMRGDNINCVDLRVLHRLASRGLFDNLE